MTMTSRERLLTVLKGEIPDCVPVAPDFSNMIPARLTGKPFWDLYLYNDPPIWEAYIDCAKHFGIDSLMDGYFPLTFPEELVTDGPVWERFIVHRDAERLVVQESHVDNGRRVWRPEVTVYLVADPPTAHVKPEAIGLPAIPKRWEPVEGVKEVDLGPEGLKRIKALLGDQGLVGVRLTWSIIVYGEDRLVAYYEQPEIHERWRAEHLAVTEARFRRIMAMDVKPDFFCIGGSGTLIYQTPQMVRELALPGLKRAIDLAEGVGIPTHVHSCGPEKELVRMFAEETRLTVIDPLECPPMGDCDLAELKRLYGQKLVLKGNLHTTEVMLRGSTDDVVRASRAAIDAAGKGGRFILSTGDQCGRDTPDANLHAMIDTARTYGRYR
ncbi:MAG: hypothetical protein A2340_02335 [Lentisphaerae bacterium RIFOXYB12_FULL_60_10]|nr:MAG: hypothetical protein A2340_02335 [Lentisphaerae bacterium RIFOXYB12_FULL_60_10]